MAAGLGTRMRSATPKHLHPMLGRRMVDWVLEAARPLEPAPLVVSPRREPRRLRRPAASPSRSARSGTGDAVRSARDAVADGADDLLVLSGDTPLLTTELLQALLDTHRAEPAAVTVLSFEPADPRSTAGSSAKPTARVRSIVEARDATPANSS